MFMDSGHWFVSVYNDDGEPQPVEILLDHQPVSGKIHLSMTGEQSKFILYSEDEFTNGQNIFIFWAGSN